MVFQFSPNVALNCVRRHDGLYYVMWVRESRHKVLDQTNTFIAHKGWPSPQIWKFFFEKSQNGFWPPLQFFWNFIALFSAKNHKYLLVILCWNPTNLQWNFWIGNDLLTFSKRTWGHGHPKEASINIQTQSTQLSVASRITGLSGWIAALFALVRIFTRVSV